MREGKVICWSTMGNLSGAMNSANYVDVSFFWPIKNGTTLTSALNVLRQLGMAVRASFSLISAGTAEETAASRLQSQSFVGEGMIIWACFETGLKDARYGAQTIFI